MAETEKTGAELLALIAQHPTLDELLDRDPLAVPYTREELTRIVEIERADRALFNIREQKARDKKDGVEPEENPTDTATE